MPETRYIEEYGNNGKVINKISYQVSDQELEKEQAEKNLEELLSLTDDQITVPKIGKFLKALARLRR